ncbi:hypothetical protein F5B21DRAFT_434350 [Xylaria acuta]|nr:hypothetical protein F5B21DRAFT_434350 [Xylaria acuta]
MRLFCCPLLFSPSSCRGLLVWYFYYTVCPGQLCLVGVTRYQVRLRASSPVHFSISLVWPSGTSDFPGPVSANWTPAASSNCIGVFSA